MSRDVPHEVIVPNESVLVDDVCLDGVRCCGTRELIQNATLHVSDMVK